MMIAFAGPARRAVKSCSAEKMRALAALCLLAGAAAIYPDDHWTYSTKLTTQEEFNSFIKAEVDAGASARRVGWQVRAAGRGDPGQGAEWGLCYRR